MSLRTAIVSQFKRPHGLLGNLAGWVMANRPSNRERNRWTVDLLALRPGARVLEVGFGPGLALEHLAETVPDAQIVGIDHSETMVAQARRRNRRAIDAGRMDVRVAAGDDLPGDLSGFDAIYSANVVMFWSEPQGVFATFFDRLASGGQVATTYQPRHPGATAADAQAMAVKIRAWMEAAGFGELRVETLELTPVPAVCVLGRR